MIDEEIKDNPKTLSLFREVNLMPLPNHPNVLEFVGCYHANFDEDPLPIIVTELAVNGSLSCIIKMKLLILSSNELTDTKKLISIYGIAKLCSSS